MDEAGKKFETEEWYRNEVWHEKTDDDKQYFPGEDVAEESERQ